LKVRALYFASARDAASKSAEEMSIPDGSSVRDLAREMVRTHPGLKALLATAKFSVNLDLATHETRLKEGDVVGLLPPVAGG
jgi:sulfur-carrier protein